MVPSQKHSTLKTIFHALRYRNFRVFFTGQSVSLVGAWIQHVAVSWLIFRLTGSAFMLGVAGFAGQIPTFILSPAAGIIADTRDRRKILLITQGASMLFSAALAYLTLSGKVQVWHIITLSCLLGSALAIDIPARHSYLIELVAGRKESLSNAIALNSFMFNAARLIGPAAAGVLIAATGEGTCFLINSVTYIAVIVSLLMIKVPGAHRGKKRSDPVKSLIEGFKYTFGFAPISAVIILLGVISLMGMSYVVLMPVFAKNVLGGGPGALGTLMSAAGLGALAATVFLASKKRVKIGYILPAAAFLFAAGIIGLALSRSLWASVLWMAVSGFGFMTHMASSSIVLQTLSDEDKRGRVMSFYSMAFMGMAPIGSFVSGALADRFGAPAAILIGGVCCAIAAIVFAREVPKLKELSHHIYEKLAEAPEVASGLNAATELTVPPED